MATVRIKRNDSKEGLVLTVNINLNGVAMSTADTSTVSQLPVDPAASDPSPSPPPTALPAPIVTDPSPTLPDTDPQESSAVPAASDVVVNVPVLEPIPERHIVWDKIEKVLDHLGLELADGAHKGYKFASIWFFVILMAAPDLYNLAVSNSLITAAATPPEMTHAINLIAFMGGASRLVKSKKSSQD